jgi:hypothetical protein
MITITTRFGLFRPFIRLEVKLKTINHRQIYEHAIKQFKSQEIQTGMIEQQGRYQEEAERGVGPMALMLGHE